jgi:hypothetical protein
MNDDQTEGMGGFLELGCQSEDIEELDYVEEEIDENEELDV